MEKIIALLKEHKNLNSEEIDLHLQSWQTQREALLASCTGHSIYVDASAHLVWESFPQAEIETRIPLRDDDFQLTPGAYHGERALMWLNPDSGRHEDFRYLNSAEPCSLIVAAQHSFLYHPDLRSAPQLANSNSWIDTAYPDSRQDVFDLQVLASRDLLFVMDRNLGQIWVFHLQQRILLTCWQIRSPGHLNTINLTFDRAGVKAYITDNVTPQLWIADLATLELRLWKSGLGILGNLLAAPEPECLYLSILSPQFNLVYFDLDSMAPHYSVEIRGVPPTQHQILAWDPFVASPETPYLFYMAVREQDGQFLPVLNVIQTEEVRTIRRTTLKSSSIPIALVSGSLNPLLAYDALSFEAWLLEQGILQSSDLQVEPVHLQAVAAENTPTTTFQSYQAPQEDLAVWEQLDQPATKIELPQAAEDILIDLVVWAFYRLTLTNLRIHPQEIQNLKKLAPHWRLRLQNKAAILIELKEILGRFEFNTPISRELVLKLLGTDTQFKPEELCPMCHAPHHKRVISEPCANCHFALTLPEKLSLSLEPASCLLPGHLLLTQNNQILSLNLWQHALQLIESKESKSMAHALALPDQTFLVSDQAGNKLVILNPEGDIVWKAKLALKQPVMATAYEIDKSLRYVVVDQGNGRILELDHSGKHWRRYPGLKTLPEDKLVKPADLQITENQHWLVSDPGLGQVVEINSKGAIIRRWGEDHGLRSPSKARRQRDGTLEVLELEQGRIVTLSARGDCLQEFIYWPLPAELLAQANLPNISKPESASVLQNGEWLLQGPDYIVYVAPKQQLIRRLAALPDAEQTQHLLKVSFQSQPAIDPRTQKQQQALQVLQQNKLLARESQEQLESLAKHVQTLRFDAGDWLLHPGEWGNAVFFIEQGLIEVCADEKDYPVIFELQAGDTCGTQAVLALNDDSLRPGLRVKEDCQLLMLERSEFKKAIVHFPKLFQLIRYVDREQQRQVKFFYERKTEAVQDQLRTRLNESQMRQFDLFDGADETFREALAESVHAMAYLPDQTICQQGESGGTVYLLLEGSIGIQRKGEYATSLILSEGDIFGEMSVVFDAPRSATLRTLDYCKLFMIEEDALRKLGREFPWFWERIVELAHQRKSANEQAWAAYQQEMGLDRPSLPMAELLIGTRAEQFLAYVPSQAHDMIIGLHSSGELVWLWGQEAQAQIFQPSRVHTHEETLIVVDTGNDRVLELDIRSRQTLRKWGGPLKKPRSAVLTPEGLLLVADEGNQRLVVIDESGREVWQYGLPQEILLPVYAQITPEGHILFVDAGMHRVYELSLDGRTLWSHGRWRNAGNGLDQLNQPAWAHRFQDGSTLIADTGNQRLVWLQADTSVKTIPLSAFDPLFQPVHIEVLANQDLLLMDPEQGLILRMNAKGDMIWGARLVFPEGELARTASFDFSESQSDAAESTPWDLEQILSVKMPVNKLENVSDPAIQAESVEMAQTKTVTESQPIADKSDLYKTRQIKKQKTEIIRKHQVSNTHQIFWSELGIEIPDPVARSQDFQGQALPEVLPELDLVLEQVADQIESSTEEHQVQALEYLAALENIDTGSTLNVNLADLDPEQLSDADDDVDDDLDFLDSLIGSS